MKFARFITFGVLSAALFGSAGCAWMLPADPYANGVETAGVKVADGMDQVYADPSLSVPEVASNQEKIIPGGHAPPNATQTESLDEAAKSARTVEGEIEKERAD